MQVHDLEELYLAELAELHSVASQLSTHLREMSARASDPDLSATVKTRQEEKSAQRDDLAGLLKVHRRDVGAHEDASMHAIVAETRKWNDMIDDAALRDIALLTSLQRMEHYQMAVLESLTGWARKLGQAEDETVLSRLLERSRQAASEFGVIGEDALGRQAA